MPVLGPNDLRLTFRCRDCEDVGYILFRCQPGDGDTTRDPLMARKRCDRPKEHQPHSYAVRCACHIVPMSYPPTEPRRPHRQRQGGE